MLHLLHTYLQASIDIKLSLLQHHDADVPAMHDNRFQCILIGWTAENQGSGTRVIPKKPTKFLVVKPIKTAKNPHQT